jgi:hypothetical protein
MSAPNTPGPTFLATGLSDLSHAQTRRVASENAFLSVWSPTPGKVEKHERWCRTRKLVERRDKLGFAIQHPKQISLDLDVLDDSFYYQIGLFDGFGSTEVHGMI